MKATFLGKVSRVGDSPTLYRSDRGTLIVQGYRVDDAEIQGIGPIPVNEVLNEIPPDLLRFAPQPGAESRTADLSIEEFYAHFERFERSCVRLETRTHTDVPSERTELAAFLAGELPEERDELPDFWTEMLARQRDAGRPVVRVRVMDEPLTDYNRYMIYSARRNVTAGEDIRFLSRADANALDLPDHDFWVFDSVRMVELRFTGDGRPLGHDLITDPPIVARHSRWIERAYAAATPWASYVAEDPTRELPPILARTETA